MAVRPVTMGEVVGGGIFEQQRSAFGSTIPLGRLALAALIGVPVGLAALVVVTLAVVGLARVVMFVPFFDVRPRVSLLAVVVTAGGAGIVAARSRVIRPAWSPSGRLGGSGPSEHESPSRWPVAIAALLSIGITMRSLLGELDAAFFDSPDARQQIGYLHLMAEEIRSGTWLPGRIDEVVVPIGVDVRAFDGYLPLWLGGLLAVIVSPILAYNLLLIGATVFNAWAGGRVARCFTDRAMVIAIAAMVLATAPAVVGRYGGHLQLVWIGVVALLAAEGIEASRRGVRPVRLAVLVAVAAATSGYYALAGVGLFAIAFAATERSRCEPTRVAVGKASLALVTAVVVTSPLLLARFDLERAEHEAGGAASYEAVFAANRAAYGVDLAELVTPQSYVTNDLGLDRARDDIESNYETEMHPGWLAVLALGAVLVMPGPGRRLVALGSTVLLLVAVGPTMRWWGNEILLHDHEGGYLPTVLLADLPLVSAIRTPSRVLLPLAVLACVAVAVVGDHLARRSRPVHAAVMTLVAVSLATNAISWPVASAPDAATMAVLDEARDRAEAGDTLLVAPADCSGEDTRYVLWQAYHQVPTVGCTAPYLALPWFSEMDVYFASEGLAGLRCHSDRLGWFRPAGRDHGVDPTVDALRSLRDELGVRFVLIDHRFVERPASFYDCTEFASEAVPLLGRWSIARTDQLELVDLSLIDG